MSEGTESEGLGQLLVQRRRRAFHMLMALLTGFAGVLFATAGAGIIATQWKAPPGQQTKLIIGVVILFAGVAFLGWAFRSIMQSRIQLCFHEHGVVQTRGRRRLTIRYDDIQWFHFAVGRQTIEGLPDSTVEMRMAGKDGKVIAHAGPFKIGVSSLFKMKYESKDELDTIKWLIAERMADGFEKLLRDDDEIMCTWRVDRKGETDVALRHDCVWLDNDKWMPYSEVLPEELTHSHLILRTRGEPERAIKIRCASENFWPNYALYMRLRAGAMG